MLVASNHWAILVKVSSLAHRQTCIVSEPDREGLGIERDQNLRAARAALVTAVPTDSWDTDMADKTEPSTEPDETDPYKTGSYKTDPYKTEPDETGPDETSDTKLLEEKEDSIEDFTEEEDTSTLVVKEKEQEADESECKPGSEPKFRLYRWRWFMLATHLLLNISNGTVCLGATPCRDSGGFRGGKGGANAPPFGG